MKLSFNKLRLNKHLSVAVDNVLSASQFNFGVLGFLLAYFGNNTIVKFVIINLVSFVVRREVLPKKKNYKPVVSTVVDKPGLSTPNKMC